MLLGLSSTDDTAAIDPSRLEYGAGVTDGQLLVDFVDALSSGEATAERRAIVAETLGPDTMVDAVAVYANFSMMTRIADGTGTPLDDGTTAMSGGLRTDLGLDDWTSRRLTG